MNGRIPAAHVVFAVFAVLDLGAMDWQTPPMKRMRKNRLCTGAHWVGEQRAASRAQSAASREQRAESSEQRAASREQSAESRAQSAERSEQRAESRAQSAERRAQSAERRAQRAESREQSAERGRSERRRSERRRSPRSPYFLTRPLVQNGQRGSSTNASNGPVLLANVPGPSTHSIPSDFILFI